MRLNSGIRNGLLEDYFVEQKAEKDDPDWGGLHPCRGQSWGPLSKHSVGRSVLAVASLCA